MLGFVLMAVAQPASATDYAYEGYFTPTPAEKSFEDAQNSCVINFFSQAKDGNYITYHLDVDAYRSSAAIRYVEYNRGRCTSISGGKVESCFSTFDINPAEMGKSYIDVPGRISENVVEITYFQSLGAAETYAENGGEPPEGARMHFNRCLDFDAARMTKYITKDRSKLSPDQVMQLTSGDPDPQTASIAGKVRDAIRADKGN